MAAFWYNAILLPVHIEVVLKGFSGLFQVTNVVAYLVDFQSIRYPLILGLVSFRFGTAESLKSSA